MEPGQGRDPRNHTVMLRVAGVIMMVAGAALAYLAVIEMYCFYLFGEGGRFAYPGFGFGSFMFANIAAQVICYYLLALMLLAVGHGHLQVRPWARIAALVLMKAWLVIGLPAVVAVFGILLASKDVSVPFAAFAGVCLILAYAVLPWLAIRFYNGRNVRRAFEMADRSPTAIEAVPVPILVLATLFALYILAMHLLVLFNGLFPLFGRWLTGLPGIQALACSILVLAAIGWGTLCRRRPAWCAALLYFALLTSSAVLTLVVSTYSDLLHALDFPLTEIAVLDRLPLQGYHLAAYVGLPLVLTMLLIVRSRPHFLRDRRCVQLQRETS
jgi:hypothetical protein